MVTLSRLYLRGVREGGVLGSPAPSRGSGGERSRSPTSSPLSWGRYPGPAFLGLLTYFPTVSGWAGRRARRRAGLDRPSALLGPWVSCRPGARGSRCRRSRPSCREHFGGGSKVSARSTRHGAAGPGSAGRWQLLPGPCPPPPPERAPPPLAFRLLPSQPVAPRPDAPSSVPQGCGCRERGSRAGGLRSGGDPAGASAGRAHASRSQSPTGAGCGLCSVSDTSLLHCAGMSYSLFSLCAVVLWNVYPTDLGLQPL